MTLNQNLIAGNFEKHINKGEEPWLIDFCEPGGGQSSSLLSSLSFHVIEWLRPDFF